MSSTSLRKHGIIFSTAHPGTIQRVPWPSTSSQADPQVEEHTDELSGEQKAITGHDVWLLNSDDAEAEREENNTNTNAEGFKWLVDREGLL